MLMAVQGKTSVSTRTLFVEHIARSNAMKTKCFAPETKIVMAVENLIFASQLILNVPHIVR